jgi:AraC-like DNA-binding protein
MLKIKDGFSGERAVVLPRSIVAEMEKDPLSSGIFITDIGYYPVARYHYIERSQPIDQNVFIYCYEGKGWFEVDGKRCTVNSNEYFILPAGVPHSYGADADSPWTIYWVHFKGTLAHYFVTLPCQPIELKPGIHSRISDRIEMFEEILSTLGLGYSRENLLYACSIFHHFLGTLKFLQQYRDAAFPNSSEVDVVTGSIHFMTENIEKRLTIKELAEYSGYSVSHFSSVFSKRTGHAPLAYFNQLKIQKACHLLDFTDIKVNQVCYKLGFDDPYYFSRLFTKVMGMSPRKYRSQKKG